MPSLTLDDIRVEIETDREWREAEIRLLKNHIASLQNAENQKILRKTLVVMLYAHFEGVCKIIFCAYVKYVNSLELESSKVSYAIVACGMAKVFDEFINSGKKHRFFKNSLPEDGKLHQLSRNREFIESFGRFSNEKVIIDEALVIDLESNLKPLVVKKIFFQLGFDYEEVDGWSGDLDLLLNFRNKIAHGSLKEGIDIKMYQNIEDRVFDMTNRIVSFISQSISRESYLLKV